MGDFFLFRFIDWAFRTWFKLVFLPLRILNKMTSTMIEGGHKDSGSTFSQNGVTVDYKNNVITIKKQPFGFEQIRKYWLEGSDVIFEVEDMKKPLRKVSFYNLKDAQTFISRFEMACSKALEEAQ